MNRLGWLLVPAAFVAGGGACKEKDKATTTSTSDACAKAKPHGKLAWIEDDYAAALACAKTKNVPLVIDLWAPWCHTCVSMQQTVFTHASFATDNDKFVFVALDTDRDVNAAAVAKYPLSAWPTFYVVAADETVLARYAGGASLQQFKGFLAAGLAALTTVEGAAKHMLAAERALAKGKLEDADQELTAAIAAAPEDWVRKPDALVSLIHTKKKRGDSKGCFEVGEQSMFKTGTSASATDFIGMALECAKPLAEAEVQRIASFRARAMERLEKLIDDSSAPLSIDDRSDAMAYLREAYVGVGRRPDAINLTERQRMMLEHAIAKAPNAMTAMTYNYQLADAYIFLGRALEAVPALEASAKALPNEYDPAARLGWVLLEGGKLPEAAAWTDKALALVYGPRKARVLAQRAQIAQKQGDKAAERTYRTQVVALWESLPAEQRNPDALAKAKDALAKVDAPPAAPSP